MASLPRVTPCCRRGRSNHRTESGRLTNWKPTGFGSGLRSPEEGALAPAIIERGRGPATGKYAHQGGAIGTRLLFANAGEIVQSPSMGEAQNRSVHIVPIKGGWRVARSGATRATKIFSDRQEAISFGRGVAKNAHSTMFVHKRNGEVTSAASYLRVSKERNKPA